MRTKELGYAVLMRFLGFVIFLVLLGIANILVYYVKNEMFSSVVFFLNNNIWLIIIFTVILLIGEIFGYLFFPLNIPGPLFNAVGGVLLVQFVFKLFNFIILLSKANFPLQMSFVEDITMLIVFVVVLVVGYVDIIREATKPKKREHLKEHIIKEKKQNIKDKRNK